MNRLLDSLIAQRNICGGVYVLLILGWLISAPIVGTIVGRAIAIADRREADMRRHPSVRPVDDFDQHADDAVNLVAADHQELADIAAWERELRGVK